MKRSVKWSGKWSSLLTLSLLACAGEPEDTGSSLDVSVRADGPTDQLDAFVAQPDTSPAVDLPIATDLGPTVDQALPGDASADVTNDGPAADQAVPSDVSSAPDLGTDLATDLAPDGPPPPDLGRLLINEIDYAQDGVDVSEYVEIFNAGEGSARLTGRVLELVNGATNAVYNEFALDAAGPELAAGAYLVLGSAAALDILPPGVATLELLGQLQNGPNDGARIVDRRDFDRVLDGVAYEGVLDGTGEGQAGPTDFDNGLGGIARCPNGVDSDDNRADLRAAVQSPGLQNICPPPEPTSMELALPPEVIAFEAFSVEVTLDLAVPLEAVGDAEVTFDFEPAASVIGPAAAVILRGEQSVTVDFRAGRVRGPVQVSVRVADYALLAEGDFTVLEPLLIQRQPIVINEVDYDQPGPDLAEFVELRNNGPMPAPLVALELHLLAAPLVPGGVRTPYEIIALDTGAQEIPVGGVLVIGVDEVLMALPPDATGLALTEALENGPGDAIALVDVYQGEPQILQLVVFGDDPDSPLHTLVVDSGDASVYSVARCPDGAGLGDNRSDFLWGQPTPGAVNVCLPPMGLSLDPVRPVAGGEFEVNVELNPPSPADDSLTLVVDVVAADPLTTCEPAPAVGGAERIVPVACVGGAAGEVTVNVTSSDGRMASIIFELQAPTPVDATLVVNEVDYDQAAIDTAEFVELLNLGAAPVDLSNIELHLTNANGALRSRTSLAAGGILLAGGRVVVGSAAIINALPLGIEGVPLVGALENGPDGVSVVAISDGVPIVLDTVTYEGVVVGSEGRLTPLADAGDFVGRSLSRCPDGADRNDHYEDLRLGTPSPGLVNDCPPAVAISVEPVAVNGGETFTLKVELALPALDTPVVVNISGDPPGAIVARDLEVPAGDWVASGLFAAGVLPGEVTLRATVGGEVGLTTLTILDAPLGRTGLVISEVDYDQAGADTAEFVEVLNTGNVGVPLAGVVLEYINGAVGMSYGGSTLTDGIDVLGPGQRLVVGSAAVGALLPPGTPYMRLNSALQNGPNDGIRLVDRNADLVLDGIAYDGILVGVGEGDAASQDAGPLSLSRCPDAIDSDDNARDFSLVATTPGAPNACP